MTWSVLCSDHRLDSAPDGSVVVCDGGIRPNLPFDAFCTILAPSALSESLDDIRAFTSRLWSPLYLGDAWSKTLSLVPEPWPWPPEIPWVPRLPRRSYFYAVSCCLHLGATKIDIYGWDGDERERIRMEDLIRLAGENQVRITLRG